jgi:DNA-binding transcriptional LysR family regulator
MKVRARVGDFDAVCRMVEVDAGSGVVPEAAMRLKFVRLSDAWASRRLAICVRRLSSLHPGAQRLVAHLKRELPV